LALKIASIYGGVIDIVQSLSSRRKIFFQGAQQTRLAAAEIPGDNGGGAAFDSSF
jgi:hypothetical protein